MEQKDMTDDEINHFIDNRLFVPPPPDQREDGDGGEDGSGGVMHVAHHPALNRVYAGYAQPGSYRWSEDRHDVTDAACGAVAELVHAHGDNVMVRVNGEERYQLSVQKADDLVDGTIAIGAAKAAFIKRFGVPGEMFSKDIWDNRFTYFCEGWKRGDNSHG